MALPIRSREECKIPEPDLNGNLTDGMFCAGFSDGREGADACHGDSGGPLVRKMPPVDENDNVASSEWREQWYQVGIVSWGIGCSKRGHYGYYTHVPYFREWIDSVISATEN